MHRFLEALDAELDRAVRRDDRSNPLHEELCDRSDRPHPKKDCYGCAKLPRDAPSTETNEDTFKLIVEESREEMTPAPATTRPNRSAAPVRSGNRRFPLIVVRDVKSEVRTRTIPRAAKKNEAAVEVFKLNTELYPKSGNTFDSLGETYLALGDRDAARKCYERALEVQPDYSNAKGAKELLETKLR